MEVVRTGTILGSKAESKEELHFRRTAADTAGRLLEIEATYAPHSAFPPAHLHPAQQETFTLLAGTLTVRMSGREQRYEQGSTFTVPRGTVHTMANRDAVPTRVRWETRPALETAEFFAAFYRLAQPDGPRGLGRAVRLLLLARRFRHEIILTSPPPVMQRLLFALLAPVAWFAEGRTVRTIDERIDIARSPAEVFAVFTDYDRDSQWRGTRTMAAKGVGTEARYALTAELRGDYRLLAPLLVASFRRGVRADLLRLKSLVETGGAGAAR